MVFAQLKGRLQSLVTSNLRHLDVVSAKTGLSPCGLDLVFILKTKATGWCPRKSTQCRSDEISVQLNFCVSFLEFEEKVIWS